MAGRFGVLVTCAGRRVGLLGAVRDSLRALNLDGPVVAADSSPLAPALLLADHAAVVGPISDPGYVDELLDLCRRFGVRLVIPTIDAELPLYAACRGRFERAGISVVVGSPRAVAIAMDKAHTHRWLTRRGFPTVRQATIDEVLTNTDSWSFPVVVKPRRGNSARGVAFVADPDGLAALGPSPDLLVQDVAQGDEHTIDALIDRSGHCRCAVPRLRVEVRGGEVSKARTVRDPEMQGLVAAVCTALPGAYGTMNVQLFRDGTALRIIEINARFGGGFPLTHAAGAPFVRWLVEEALGLPSTAAPDGWDDGLTMLRYDEALFVRDVDGLGATRAGFGTEL